jgi:hypothetical protein
MEPRRHRLATPTELGPDPEPLGVRYDVLMVRIEAPPAEAHFTVAPTAPTEEISERVAALVGA